MISYLYWGSIIVGSILVIFGIKMYNDTQKLLLEGVKTTATVVDLIKESNSDDDGEQYTPVFEFLDRKNNVRKFRSEVSSNPPTHGLGKVVKIIYHPKNIDEVKILSYWGLYRWTIVLFSLASPLLIIGTGYLIYTSR